MEQDSGWFLVEVRSGVGDREGDVSRRADEYPDPLAGDGPLPGVAGGKRGIEHCLSCHLVGLC